MDHSYHRFDARAGPAARAVRVRTGGGRRSSPQGRVNDSDTGRKVLRAPGIAQPARIQGGFNVVRAAQASPDSGFCVGQGQGW